MIADKVSYLTYVCFNILIKICVEEVEVLSFLVLEEVAVVFLSAILFVIFIVSLRTFAVVGYYLLEA